MLERDWPAWYLTAWLTNSQTDYNTPLPLAGEGTTLKMQCVVKTNRGLYWLQEVSLSLSLRYADDDDDDDYYYY